MQYLLFVNKEPEPLEVNRLSWLPGRSMGDFANVILAGTFALAIANPATISLSGPQTWGTVSRMPSGPWRGTSYMVQSTGFRFGQLWIFSKSELQNNLRTVTFFFFPLASVISLIK